MKGQESVSYTHLQGLSDGEQADAQASVPRRWDGKEKLTDREMEVLALVANGESNRGIAGQLLISEKTVKNHISSILRKLGMSGRTEAAVWAVRRGLLAEVGLKAYNRRPSKNES